jgi:hypothetical protein
MAVNELNTELLPFAPYPFNAFAILPTPPAPTVIVYVDKALISVVPVNKPPAPPPAQPPPPPPATIK